VGSPLRPRVPDEYLKALKLKPTDQVRSKRSLAAPAPVVEYSNKPQSLFGGWMQSRDTVGEAAKWRSNESL